MTRRKRKEKKRKEKLEKTNGLFSVHSYNKNAEGGE
jgi:hypothetical protein